MICFSNRHRCLVSFHYISLHFIVSLARYCHRHHRSAAVQCAGDHKFYFPRCSVLSCFCEIMAGVSIPSESQSLDVAQEHRWLAKSDS